MIGAVFYMWLKGIIRLEPRKKKRRIDCECGTCIQYKISNCKKDLGCNRCNPAGIGIFNR